MKTKRTLAGGTEYRLAPLTFGQVESLASEPDPWVALVWSLENAGGSINPAVLKSQLDIDDFRVLYEAVLAESGLAPNEKHEGGPTDFAELRCALITALGWTSADVDQTPFPVALDLFARWSAHPPVASSLEILLSVFTTWRPGPGRRAKEHTSKEEAASVITEYGGRVQSFDCLPAEIQALLDRDLHIFEKRNQPEKPNEPEI